MAVRVEGVRRIARWGVVAALGVAVPLCAGPAWAGGPPSSARQRAAAVSGPERSAVVGTPSLTTAEQAEAARKDAAVPVTRVRDDHAMNARSTTSSRAASKTDDPVAMPVHRSIKKITQKAQARTYWCGPATLATLVQASDKHISETTAAKRLKTTRNGTNWYSGSGNYPMERALEHYSKGFDYTPANLPYTPDDDDVATFKQRLMTDVVVHQQGIAGNAYEVRNGPHLKGHPNRTIFHWVAVRGFDDNGDTTRIADPVAGSSISWAGGVPRYSEIDTDKIVTIFGARGYIW